MKAVLFDLDGTLLDTYDLILASFRYATSAVLGTTIPDDVLMRKVGQPLAVQMEDFTEDSVVQRELLRVYREHNALVHDDLVGVFPGTIPLLESLRSTGIPMGIVTSKRHATAMQGLSRFELEGFFEFLIGSDDWPEHKPHPGPVMQGCDRLGLSCDQCLYVGDSPFDIQAGNAAGCMTAAALWGMFSRASLAKESPNFLCAESSDVLVLLENR